MASISKNGVSHIVIVRDLDVITDDYVLQLHAVSYDAVLPDKGASPDKGAVSHLSALSDDAR